MHSIRLKANALAPCALQNKLDDPNTLRLKKALKLACTMLIFLDQIHS